LLFSTDNKIYYVNKNFYKTAFLIATGKRNFVLIVFQVHLWVTFNECYCCT